MLFAYEGGRLMQAKVLEPGVTIDGVLVGERAPDDFADPGILERLLQADWAM